MSYEIDLTCRSLICLEGDRARNERNQSYWAKASTVLNMSDDRTMNSFKSTKLLVHYRLLLHTVYNGHFLKRYVHYYLITGCEAFRSKARTRRFRMRKVSSEEQSDIPLWYTPTYWTRLSRCTNRAKPMSFQRANSRPSDWPFYSCTTECTGVSIRIGVLKADILYKLWKMYFMRKYFEYLCSIIEVQ